MIIELPKEQQAWLEAQVTAGIFPTIEAAAEAAVAAAMVATAEAEAADLAWAKPYVDRARADIERGDTLALSEFKLRMSAQREQFER